MKGFIDCNDNLLSVSTRVMLAASNVVFQLDNELTVTAQLVSSTYTSDATYLLNSDGYYQKLPANAGIKTGKRCVYSLARSNLYTVSTGGNFGTASRSLDTTNKIYTFTVGAGSGNRSELLITDAALDVVNKYYGTRLQIKSSSATDVGKTINLRLDRYQNGSSNFIDRTITLTSDYTDFWVGENTFPVSGTQGLKIGVWGISEALECNVRKIAPYETSFYDADMSLYALEYVDESVNYGVGVVGVKYFDAEIADSVNQTTYVITSATGSALAETDGEMYVPPATCLNKYSNDFSNAAWVKGTVTIIRASDIGPTGVAGWEVTLDSTLHALYQGSITVSSSTVHTFTFYAKRGTATELKYSVRDQTNAVDIIAATSYYSQTNSSTYSKITITFTTPATCTSVYIYPVRDSGVTGTVYIACANIVALPFAVNYIETTSSTVSWTGKTHTFTHPASLMNNFYYKFTIKPTSSDSITSRRFLSIGTAANRFDIYQSNTNAKLTLAVTIASSSTYINLSDSGLSNSTQYVCYVYYTNGVVTCKINGVAQATNTNIGLDLALTATTGYISALYDSSKAYSALCHIKDFEIGKL